MLADAADQEVVIGSHTISHPHLPRLSDEELRSELVESRQQLEARLGPPCDVLAYPYGEADARVRAAAWAAGYSMAFALRGEPGPRDVFGLPRVDLYRKDGTARFALKTLRARRPVTRALDAVRRARDLRRAP